MMHRTVRFLAVASVAISMAVVSGTATGSTAFDDNQVPILNMAGEGDLHIFADDSLEEQVVDPPSMLALGTASNTEFCADADSGVCAGQSKLWYYAHLPVCDSSVITDCIVSVSAQSKGSTSAATFTRYYPNRSATSFTGKPSANLPTGRAPSVWSIPGAPHVGGDNYIVVARLNGGLDRRAANVFQLVLTPVSLKNNADTSSDYQMGRWIQPGRLGGPAADRGSFRCAYWGESGSCMLSHSFPADVSYTVVVRLSVEPAGWLHGRVKDPTISFTKTGSNTEVTVSAAPVQVPAFRLAKKHLEHDPAVQTSFGPGKYSAGSRRPGGAELTDVTRRNAEYNIQAWKTEGFEQFATVLRSIGDKADYAPWIWRVRTLTDNEMNTAGKCLTNGDGVKGIVTTNATIYGSGPPAYNPETKTLDYKVAAPHYTRTGEEFKGAYHLHMRSDVARCFYGFTDAPVTGSVSVVEENGTPGTAVTNISESGGWLKVSATGFTHSAPVVKVALTQPALTQPAPKTTITSVRTKTNRSLSATSLAKKARLNVPRGAKVTVSVPKKHAKVCRATATSVRALRKGTCSATVTVTSKGRKSRATVTITAT